MTDGQVRNHHREIKAAVAREREECAKIADAHAALAWGVYKGTTPESADYEWLKRADSYTEGHSDGANDVANKIRARVK